MTEQAEVVGVAESEIIGMKHWDDAKRCWHGVVCQVRRDDAGKEFIQVYDVGAAETQIEIDDWIRNSLATEPWNKNADAEIVGK